jgi:hypothetical protein
MTICSNQVCWQGDTAGGGYLVHAWVCAKDIGWAAPETRLTHAAHRLCLQVAQKFDCLAVTLVRVVGTTCRAGLTRSWRAHRAAPRAATHNNAALCSCCRRCLSKTPQTCQTSSR